jgi:hypothetical protein
MPIIPYEQARSAQLGEPAKPIEPEFHYTPSLSQAFSIGLEESPIGSLERWAADKWDPTVSHEADPTYDVFNTLEGTPYSAYANDFIHVSNAQEAEQVKRRIDRELYRNHQMADVSFFSLPGVANLAGNVVGDPTVLIPGGEAVEGVRLGRAVGESALRSGAAGVAASSLAEGSLQATEETRTWDQSALNIGTAALLSAGLGALGGLHSGIRARVDTPGTMAERVLDTYGSGSMGAAQAGSETSLAGEGLKSAFGVEKLLTPTSPLLRAAASPSIATRRTMQQLAEDGLLRAKNAEGIPNDIPVTRRMELYRAGLADALVGLDDSFTQYRLGRASQVGDSVRLAAEDATGRTGEKLSRRDFAIEVGRAMLRNDEHDIPEVAKAAKLFRATVFDPLKDAAIENGLLPPGVQSQVADSYLTRLYDREKIAARRKSYVDANGVTQPGFEDRVGMASRTARKPVV